MARKIYKPLVAVTEDFIEQVTKGSPVDLDRKLDALIRKVRKLAKDHPEAPEELKEACAVVASNARFLKQYRKKKDLDSVTVLSMGLGILFHHFLMFQEHVSMVLTAKSIMRQRETLRLGPLSSYGSKEDREKIVAEWKQKYDQFPAHWSNRHKCREIARTTPHRNRSKCDAKGQPMLFTWQGISKAIRESARHQ